MHLVHISWMQVQMPKERPTDHNRTERVEGVGGCKHGNCTISMQMGIIAFNLSNYEGLMHSEAAKEQLCAFVCAFVCVCAPTTSANVNEQGWQLLAGPWRTCCGLLLLLWVQYACVYVCASSWSMFARLFNAFLRRCNKDWLCTFGVIWQIDGRKWTFKGLTCNPGRYCAL